MLKILIEASITKFISWPIFQNCLSKNQVSMNLDGESNTKECMTKIQFTPPHQSIWNKFIYLLIVSFYALGIAPLFWTDFNVEIHSYVEEYLKLLSTMYTTY